MVCPIVSPHHSRVAGRSAIRNFLPQKQSQLRYFFLASFVAAGTSIRTQDSISGITLVGAGPHAEQADPHAIRPGLRHVPVGDAAPYLLAWTGTERRSSTWAPY
jgi:hypothetical protein